MDKNLLAICAAAALVAVPGAANASAATIDLAFDDPSANHHCSPQPYLAELVCRVFEAYCALVCGRALLATPAA